MLGVNGMINSSNMIILSIKLAALFTAWGFVVLAGSSLLGDFTCGKLQANSRWVYARVWIFFAIAIFFLMLAFSFWWMPLRWWN